MEEAILLRDMANYLSFNEMDKEASFLYEKAFYLSNDVGSFYNVVLAYIKLSTKVKEKRDRYLKKAKKLLDGFPLSSERIDRLRAIVYSLLGKEEKAYEFSKRIRNVFSFSNEDHCLKYLELEELKKIFLLVEGVELGERLNYLKSFFGEFEDRMVKARELKRIYSRVVNQEGFDFLLSKTAKLQAVAFFYIHSLSKESISILKKHSLYFLINTENLPSLTAFVLDNIGGVSIKKSGIPNFIKSLLLKIKKLNDFLSELEGDVLDVLIKVKEFLEKEQIPVEFEERERIYRDDVRKIIKSSLKHLVHKLYQRAISYYSEREANKLLESVVDGLFLSKKEKEEFISSF